MSAKRLDKKELLRSAWSLIFRDDEWPFDPEYKFHATRKWRFDWAEPDLKLAVEVEGVTHFGKGIGRHQSATGIEGDMEKYNAAALLGWTVLRFSQRHLTREPVQCCELIRDVALVLATRKAREGRSHG